MIKVFKRRRTFKLCVILTATIFIILMLNESDEFNDPWDPEVVNGSAIWKRHKISNRIYDIIYDKLVSIGSIEKFRFYSDDEFKLTKRFIINKEEYCGTNHGQDDDLIIVVLSTVHRFSYRTAIRDTWGGHLKSKGYKVFFIVGKTANETIQKQVFEEDKQHEDIIQASFIDDYYNLTLKTMSMLHTLSKWCNKVKYVLKTDEDVIINSENLLKVMREHSNERKVLLGLLLYNSGVDRDIRDRWFLPNFMYAPEKFPTYASGPICVFSGDCIEPMSIAVYKLNPHFIDDVYLTGIVAEAIGIRRISVSLNTLHTIKPEKIYDVFDNYVGFHSYNATEIIKIWRGVY